MTKNTSNTRRTGFTLVELLIVIVVIGILSAMMMLSSTEAVSSAKAADIISNLRNLKTAALAVYVDSYDLFKTAGRGQGQGERIEKNAAFISAVKKHLSSNIDKLTAEDSLDDGYYAFYNGNGYDQSAWYVVYKIPANDTAVKQKLIARASSVGLIKGRQEDQRNTPYDGTAPGNSEGQGGRTVYMLIQ